MNIYQIRNNLYCKQYNQLENNFSNFYTYYRMIYINKYQMPVKSIPKDRQLHRLWQEGDIKMVNCKNNNQKFNLQSKGCKNQGKSHILNQVPYHNTYQYKLNHKILNKGRKEHYKPCTLTMLYTQNIDQDLYCITIINYCYKSIFSN